MPAKNPKQVGDRRLRQDFFINMAAGLKQPVALIEEHLGHLPARAMPVVETWIKDALLDAQTDPVRIPHGAGAGAAPEPVLLPYITPQVIESNLASLPRRGKSLTAWFTPAMEHIMKEALPLLPAVACDLALETWRILAFRPASYIPNHINSFTLRIEAHDAKDREFERLQRGELRYMFHLIADNTGEGVYATYLIDLRRTLAGFAQFGEPRIAHNSQDGRAFYCIPFDKYPSQVLWSKVG